MNKIILYMILLMHTIIVLFVIVSPFLNNNYLLLLHTIIIPFIVIHWYFNDNLCVLTIIEKNIRQKIYNSVPNNSDCFTYNFINPIYKFKTNNKNFSKFIYTITIILWSISFGRLIYKYKTHEIKSITHLLLPNYQITKLPNYQITKLNKLIYH
jgi:hypothetical protein